LRRWFELLIMFQEASPCPDDNIRPASLVLVGSSLPSNGNVTQAPLQESLTPALPPPILAAGYHSVVEQPDYPMTDLVPQAEVDEVYGCDGSRVTAEALTCADNSCGVPPDLFEQMFRRIGGTLMQGLCQEFVFIFGRMGTDDELTSLFTVSAEVASTLQSHHL
jgi:hypothetical protein